ncbi:hypothetical protein B7463_g72, partial [Scytalidium lignicola]
MSMTMPMPIMHGLAGRRWPLGKLRRLCLPAAARPLTHNAIQGFVYEIWNEPDISIFWKGKGGMQQWIDLYIRTYKIIRSDFRFDGLKIGGPSLAFRPTPNNLWWTEWLRQIAGNNTPDEYNYHLEGAANAVDNDPSYTNSSLAALLTTYNLPQRQVNVNEYTEFMEQVPASYAWWIARLERVSFISLLVDRSGDTHLDVYAIVGDDRVRLLVGLKLVTGTWYVTVDDLEAIGHPSSGSLFIDTWRFDGSDVFAVQAPPSFRNTVSHLYSGGSVFPIY